ncbi:MAG: hypothetical protein JNM68_10960, partial [Dinghuibacter sp.]|nr:hypothetical protein [Dinghuibacter sp.]
RFNGTTWETVGSAGFTPAAVSAPALAIDRQGNAYLAFVSAAHANAASVMKYTGSAWVHVGNPAITPGPVSEMQLCITTTGIPYIAFSEEYNGGKGVVLRYYFNNWENEMQSNFSLARASNISLALDTNNFIWVGYMDASLGGKGAVKQYGGHVWTSLGTYPFFSTDSAFHISLAIDPNAIPYVAYSDKSNGGRVTVKRLGVSFWETLDVAGFSNKPVTHTSLTMTDDGLPLLVYNDDFAWVKLMKEQIVSANIVHTQAINPPVWGVFRNGCEAIAHVNPAPYSNTSIFGQVTVSVWFENTQPAQFVKRHYEILPPVEIESREGAVTLFFTQAEFDAFNAVNTVKLPTNPNDAAGKANLRITKRDSASSDGSGLPHTYAGNFGCIDPPDNGIVWDSIQKRWELSFRVTGFGGFWVGTSNTLAFNACGGRVNRITTGVAGAAYQWQLNTGSGFTNITNNTVYSGATTHTLSISGLPTSSTGTQYRCVADGVAGQVYTIKYETVWRGATSSNWFAGSNWFGCGAVPDAYTDVLIPGNRPNYPVLNASTAVRSLRTQPGSSVNIQTGAVLTITQ